MKWKKLGLVFSPDKNFPWMQTHASNPFAEILDDNLVRVYFSCRNSNNQSHVGYVDVDFTNHFKVKNISSSPVLSPGELGTFDDSGISLGYMININGRKFLYYVGWNLKVTVPWLNAIGLAIWDDRLQSWVKQGRAPLLDRSNDDPFALSYPCVIADNGKYRMWYGSNLKWGPASNDMSYAIKYAESNDGIHWIRDNHIAIPLREGENAVAKPCVLIENGVYRMWYSFRNVSKNGDYRAGYAESKDGRVWTRMDDQAGIDVSESGWDSEMICYSYVFTFKGQKYMLYNGNGYGKTGFGVAILA